MVLLQVRCGDGAAQIGTLLPRGSKQLSKLRLHLPRYDVSVLAVPIEDADEQRWRVGTGKIYKVRVLVGFAIPINGTSRV